MDEKQFEAYLESYEALASFAARYRGDEQLRARIDGGDYSDLHATVPEGMEVRVVHQTPEVYYMPMPEDPNSALADQQLNPAAGGSACIGIRVGPIGGRGFMTVATIPGCLSSGGNLGTASTNQAT